MSLSIIKKQKFIFKKTPVDSFRLMRTWLVVLIIAGSAHTVGAQNMFFDRGETGYLADGNFFKGGDFQSFGIGFGLSFRGRLGVTGNLSRRSFEGFKEINANDVKVALNGVLLKQGGIFPVSLEVGIGYVQSNYGGRYIENTNSVLEIFGNTIKGSLYRKFSLSKFMSVIPELSVMNYSGEIEVGFHHFLGLQLLSGKFSENSFGFSINFSKKNSSNKRQILLVPALSVDDNGDYTYSISLGLARIR